ncbi:MAG: SAM-dependent methyltransferase [Erysipelothrix sp.]|nr:SAM-dependent methyltransferase [Erysipelothrix sp.]
MKQIINNWKDYEILDFGAGIKFERWGNVVLKRPDPLAIGKIANYHNLNNKTNIYYDDLTGKGKWVFKDKTPATWTINYKDMVFKVSPTSHKHLGLFPEQTVNWDFVRDKIKNSNRPIKVLNLFAYTGAATINAAKAGAVEVVHVDALKQVNDWAKENSILSGSDDKLIRYICDDAITFLKREVKRGNKYQAIIMDPPSFGRGPKNQIWKFEDNIDELLKLATQLLEDPLCLVISVYKTDFYQEDLRHLLGKYLPKQNISTYDLFLPATSKKILQAGITGIYQV